MTIEELKNAIADELTIELGLADEDNAVLALKVDNAIRTVKRARNYGAAHSEDFIADDIAQFWSNIHDLALYSYNQIGAEGQASHNENGINRTWKSETECLNGIVPFIKLV